jgi:hypothetical protein
MLSPNMRTLFKSSTIGALGSAVCLLLGADNLPAQDGPPQGNFDPAQMRQRALERIREQMDVKDDTEWKAIAERLEKVMQARREMGGPGGPGGMGFGGGRGGPGGFGGRGRPGGAAPQAGPDGLPPQDGPGGPLPQGQQGGPDAFGPPDGGPDRGPNADSAGQGRRGGFRNGPGGFAGPGGFPRETSPELEALRKALDNNASASEIKTKLADLRAARKKKEAELEKAQNGLREVLSVRQEAVAVTLGFLP